MAVRSASAVSRPDSRPRIQNMVPTSLSGPGPLPWTYTYLRTSWISGQSSPVPCSTGQHGTDIAHGRLIGRHNVLLRAGRVRPHHLVTGDADLSRFLQGDLGHGAGPAEDD